MTPDDLQHCLKMWHIAGPYQSLRAAAITAGYNMLDSLGKEISLRDDLNSITQLRHNCAHQSTYQVSNTVLRTLPHRIKRIACPFDMLASQSAALLRSGDTHYLQNSDAVDATTLVSLTIRQRDRGYALVKQGRSRAIRTDSTIEPLLSRAAEIIQNSAVGGIVFVHDTSGDLLDWITI